MVAHALQSSGPDRKTGAAETATMDYGRMIPRQGVIVGSEVGLLRSRNAVLK